MKNLGTMLLLMVLGLTFYFAAFAGVTEKLENEMQAVDVFQHIPSP